MTTVRQSVDMYCRGMVRVGLLYNNTLVDECAISSDIQYTRNADKQIRVPMGALCGLSPRYYIHNILFGA
jgi:hypothetical protein